MHNSQGFGSNTTSIGGNATRSACFHETLSLGNHSDNDSGGDEYDDDNNDDNNDDKMMMIIMMIR